MGVLVSCCNLKTASENLKTPKRCSNRLPTENMWKKDYKKLLILIKKNTFECMPGFLLWSQRRFYLKADDAANEEQHNEDQADVTERSDFLFVREIIWLQTSQNKNPVIKQPRGKRKGASPHFSLYDMTPTSCCR